MILARFKQRFVLLVRDVLRASGAGLLLLVTNCGGAVTTATYELECETGTQGCGCYGNWSCNYQLSCIEEVCVDRKNSPVADDKKSSPVADDKELNRSESLPDPLAAATTDACFQCLQDDCSTELEACYPETGCIALQACLLECATHSDSADDCANQCTAQAPDVARLKSAPVNECSQRRCAACQAPRSD